MMLGLMVVGCGNVFKSMETLDDIDKERIAELEAESGSYSKMIEVQKKKLDELGVDLTVPTKAASAEAQEAVKEYSEAVLKNSENGPMDMMADVLDIVSSANNTDESFIADLEVSTANKDEVLQAAANYRYNVNTENVADTTFAAAAEVTAVTIILNDAFDGDLSASTNAAMADADKVAAWDAAISDDLLGHAGGAIEMLEYTSANIEVDDMDDATKQLEELEALQVSKNAGMTDAEFAAELDRIMGWN